MLVRARSFSFWLLSALLSLLLLSLSLLHPLRLLLVSLFELLRLLLVPLLDFLRLLLASLFGLLIPGLIRALLRLLLLLGLPLVILLLLLLQPVMLLVLLRVQMLLLLLKLLIKFRISRVPWSRHWMRRKILRMRHGRRRTRHIVLRSSTRPVSRTFISTIPAPVIRRTIRRSCLSRRHSAAAKISRPAGGCNRRRSLIRRRPQFRVAASCLLVPPLF